MRNASCSGSHAAVSSPPDIATTVEASCCCGSCGRGAQHWHPTQNICIRPTQHHEQQAEQRRDKRRKIAWGRRQYRPGCARRVCTPVCASKDFGGIPFKACTRRVSVRWSTTKQVKAGRHQTGICQANSGRQRCRRRHVQASRRNPSMRGTRAFGLL